MEAEGVDHYCRGCAEEVEGVDWAMQNIWEMPYWCPSG